MRVKGTTGWKESHRLLVIVHIDYTKTTSSLRLPRRKWEGRENSLKCNIYNNYLKKIITVCKIKELKLY